jgi:hypothetical protein
MAEYGAWNRKGATLSDVTAQAEYGVSRDFIVTKMGVFAYPPSCHAGHEGRCTKIPIDETVGGSLSKLFP